MIQLTHTAEIVRHIRQLVESAPFKSYPGDIVFKDMTYITHISDGESLIIADGVSVQLIDGHNNYELILRVVDKPGDKVDKLEDKVDKPEEVPKSFGDGPE